MLAGMTIVHESSCYLKVCRYILHTLYGQKYVDTVYLDGKFKATERESAVTTVREGPFRFHVCATVHKARPSKKKLSYFGVEELD